MAKKCVYKKGGYLETACQTMRDSIQFHPTKRSKGMFSQSITNIKTGDMKGALVSIHSGDYTSNGIVVNFCPFCGQEMRDMGEDINND